MILYKDVESGFAADLLPCGLLPLQGGERQGGFKGMERGGSGYLDSPSKSDPPPDSYTASRGGRPSRAGVSSAQAAVAAGGSRAAAGRGSSGQYGGQYEAMSDAAPALAPLRTRATPSSMPADGPLSSEAAWSSSSPSAPASPSFFEKSANKLDELTLVELTPVTDPERALSGEAYGGKGGEGYAGAMSGACVIG